MKLANRIMKTTFILMLFFMSGATIAQTAPCGLTYGSDIDVENITLQMYDGSIADAVAAINDGKNTRGTSVGCPEIEITYSTGDFTVPSLTEIVTVWNAEIRPDIESYTIDCPRIGRYENNLALGAYYAKNAGYYDNLSSLAAINEMMEAQQFTASNFSGTITSENEGVFGYIHVDLLNPCYPGGVVGASVDAVCDAIPEFCVDYDLGIYAGENFLIADQYPDYDFYDGGIAYDHGWNGISMIEAAIQQTDPALKTKFKQTAILASQWAMNEPPVRNHNYTAKLIWLLAELYAWSGEEVYKTELNYRLNKNLIPGILMDLDANGEVDDMTPTVLFSDLSQIAQRPGRMWDGHNALPWYNAMNAWAMTEAYVAFRDQGDVARAAELKPYAIAMLDNLAWEVNNLGVIPDQLGVRDLAYGLLIGIWKVSQFEAEAHPEWKSAAWALWNSGYFNELSTHSVCVGLYLNIRTETTYQPLAEREPHASIQTEDKVNQTLIYPNPSNGDFSIKYDGEFDIAQVTDMQGKVIFTKNNPSQYFTLSAPAGTYILELKIGDKVVRELLILK
jgi:hypothetical protein